MTTINERLKDSISRGVSWTLSHQQSNGEFKDCGRELFAYYKALPMFAFCGYLEAGSRCLGYIRDNLRDENGELCSGDIKTSLGRIQRNLPNYMDGWVVIGAWHLEYYDFAQSIMAIGKKQQSKTIGAISTGPKKWAGEERFDIATAASYGRAYLISGLREQAFDNANFLVAALNKQNDINEGLYLCFDRDFRPLEAPDPAERTYYWFDVASRGEKVWFPAFASAFLCEAYQVTGNKKYLKAAMGYFDVITRIPEFRERTLANGKTGWAAGLLYQNTGDKAFSGHFKWILPNVMKRQTAEGEFGASPRSGTSVGVSTSDSPLFKRIEKTSEFTLWCAKFLCMSLTEAELH